MGGGSSETPKLYYVLYEQPLTENPEYHILEISHPSNIISLKYHILKSSYPWNITSFKYLCWEISYFNSIVEEFHSNSFPRYAEEFQYESWTSIGISKLRAEIEWKQNKLFKLLTYLDLMSLIASCIPGISNVMHPFYGGMGEWYWVGDPCWIL